MKKIISETDAILKAKELRKNKKSIVVVGGCFDILHHGHLVFLENAKKEGDALFVLLESDMSVKKLKGEKRPVNNQIVRAEALAGLDYVNFIVSMSGMKKDKDYDKLMRDLKPSVLATTYPDENILHKERQAGIIGARIVYVTKRIEDYSTTKILKENS